MEADLFRQAFDGERTVGVDLFVTGLVGALGRVDQGLRGIEFRHDAVDGIALHTMNLDIALAFIPSPRIRAEGCAFRRSRWPAGCAGTGTLASGTCQWCRCRTSSPSGWGSTCPTRKSGSRGAGS